MGSLFPLLSLAPYSQIIEVQVQKLLGSWFYKIYFLIFKNLIYYMEEKWSIVTFILITVNLAIFLFFYNSLQIIISNFGLSPSFFILKPYTLVTHMFIHTDIFHFVGNMLMLFILGLMVENKIGSGKFLFIYLFSGICAIPFAFLIEVITSTHATLIGASGAIFGVMFIGGLLSGWEKVPIIKLPLPIAIAFYLLFTLILFMLYFPYSISEFAHFGGFVGGILGFLLLLPEEKKVSRI